MNTSSDIYSLCWSNHNKNLKSTLDIFRCENELVDVTLSCEGRKLKAHKIVLSACSYYFLDLFRDNPCQHPIIILRDVKYQIMVDILNFMYQGEVNVAIEQLDTFLKTAELLHVKGLVEDLSSTYEKGTKGGKESGEKQAYKSSSFDSTDGPLALAKEKDDPMEVVEPSMKAESDSEDMLEHNSSEYIDMNITRNDLTLDQAISLHDTLDETFQSNISGTLGKDSCFPCRYCEKVFSHPNSLKLHLPRHSGSTRCALCPAVLSRKYELKVHMRKKHNIELN